MDQGTFSASDGYPTPSWPGPDGYTFVVHNIGDGGFVVTPDGELITSERP